MKKNLTIRNAAKESGVKLWQIADELGMLDVNFCKKLRHELPPDETEKILAIIARLAEGVKQ